MTRLPVHFVSHGGGPWPWLKAEYGSAYDVLETSLQRMAGELAEPPRAVLMISAHWETPVLSVACSERPAMIYDYSGFPAHTYRIQYPAPGSPVLARRVQALLEQGGVAARLDPERGFDHGAYAVLAVAFPRAEVPVVQLSLRRDFDPAFHLQVGALLQPLRDEGVLIIGSGSSFHNLRLLNPAGSMSSRAFDQWLQDTVTAASPEERRRRLIHWTQAPAARLVHEREEHLLPLMVAVGAAGSAPGVCDYHEEAFFGQISVSGFRFDA